MKLFLTFWLKSPITTLWDKSTSEKKFTNTFGLCSQGRGFGELEVRWGGGINHTGKESHIIPAQWLGLGYPTVTSPQEIQGGCLPELNSCMEKFLCFRIWLFPFCSIWVDLEGGNILYHSSWKQTVRMGTDYELLKSTEKGVRKPVGIHQCYRKPPPFPSKPTIVGPHYLWIPYLWFCQLAKIYL